MLMVVNNPNDMVRIQPIIEKTSHTVFVIHNTSELRDNRLSYYYTHPDMLWGIDPLLTPDRPQVIKTICNY